MQRYASVVILILILFTSNAHATNWISPDGKLGFDLPIDGSLVELKNPPAPATAMWKSADGTTRLVFLTQPNPQNVPLNRSAFEDGTLKGVSNSTILSSDERSIGGVPVLTIAVTDHKSACLQQSVMTFDGTVYKL